MADNGDTPEGISWNRGGPRLARFCVGPKGVTCNWRSFSDPTATCPEHGGSFTVSQPDNRYFGRKTPTHRQIGGPGAPDA